MKRGIVLEGLCASWISRGGITSVSLKAVRRSARRCDEFYPVRKSGYAGTRGQTGNVGIAKDPTSPATESSRSNMIALRHSINQIYGEAAASDVADALRFATDDRPLNE